MILTIVCCTCYTENGLPIQSTFCIDKAECSTFGGEKTIFTSDSPELLQRTLAINIAADLSAAVIEDPADYFGLDSRSPYDVSLLYDRGAGISSRARSMLASARRAEDETVEQRKRQVAAGNSADDIKGQDANFAGGAFFAPPGRHGGHPGSIYRGGIRRRIH